MSPPTVLVTGGSGFLGSHIVDAFVATGRFRVHAISRNPTKYCNPKAEYRACDVIDHNSMATTIDLIAPDIIVHTVTPGPFASPQAHQTDYLATKNLLNLAKTTPSVKAFLYSGSTNTISNLSGARKTPLPESEAILHTPKTTSRAYDRWKTASTIAVLGANSEDLRTTVMYLPGMYGPRDNTISLQLAQMAKTIATRVQLGRNEVVHEWLYIESAAYAHILASSALLNPGKIEAVGGQAFFITDGETTKFWDFARRIWVGMGDEGCLDVRRRIVVPWWVVVGLAVVCEVLTRVLTFGRGTARFSRGHVRYMKGGAWVDIGKARERLGYEPLVDTEEGVRRTVAWMRESGVTGR